MGVEVARLRAIRQQKTINTLRQQVRYLRRVNSALVEELGPRNVTVSGVMRSQAFVRRAA